MAKYTPRTTAPSSNNKNYLHTSAGGYNSCILIGGGSCLPNCVGYAWGRWRELLGKNHKLSRGNAENWYLNTADGYKRGKTPKLGAVMCWRKGQVYNGNDGAGHVAVVEKIKANGDVETSESDYGGSRFKKRTYTKASGYSLGSSYTFQGFIYPPVNFEEEAPKKTTSTTSTTSKTSKYKTGDYIVTASLLNVRSGPGTNYAKKSFKQLTANAQKQVKALAGYKANGYPKGVEFTALEIKGDWARTPSGWVCLTYCKKI
jgi:hypothetical protein